MHTCGKTKNAKSRTLGHSRYIKSTGYTNKFIFRVKLSWHTVCLYKSIMSTKQREFISRRYFVPALLELLKDLDKSNTTITLWADHKWNMEWQKNTSHFHTFIPPPGPSPPIMTLPRPFWVRLNRLRTVVGLFCSTMYNGARCLRQTAVSEHRSKRRLHTSLLFFISSSKRSTRFGGSRRWHSGLASNNSTQHLMIQIGPNEEKIYYIIGFLLFLSPNQ